MSESTNHRSDNGNAGDFPKISQPALRALRGAGYFKLSDIADISDAELLKLHGMGPKALRILRQALSDRSSDAVSDNADRFGSSQGTN